MGIMLILFQSTVAESKRDSPCKWILLWRHARKYTLLQWIRLRWIILYWSESPWEWYHPEGSLCLLSQSLQLFPKLASCACQSPNFCYIHVSPLLSNLISIFKSTYFKICTTIEKEDFRLPVESERPIAREVLKAERCYLSLRSNY